jgi:hypothetical protein
MIAETRWTRPAAKTGDRNLGDNVLMVGVIIGKSEFAEGPPAYCVEFIRKGKPAREWFLAGDLEDDDEFDDTEGGDND